MNKQKELERCISAGLNLAAKAEERASKSKNLTEIADEIRFADSERENAYNNQRILEALIVNKK